MTAGFPIAMDVAAGASFAAALLALTTIRSDALSRSDPDNQRAAKELPVRCPVAGTPLATRSG
jgi:hypothetical protein